MAIEKTTKYKVFKKYQSLDNGVTWILIEPEEAEYMAWEQNSIDCGYTPPLKPDTTGSTTGDTGTTTGSTTGETEKCETTVKYNDGLKRKYVINSVLSNSDIPNIENVLTVDIGSCVTGISNYTFDECRFLSSITIPSTVTKIYSYFCRSCTSLQEISIPDSVDGIYKNSFQNCTSLSSVFIGNGVIGISQYSFEGCTNLKELTLGNSLQGIGEHCFENCSTLEELVIPASVKKINEWAFAGCKNLTSVTIKNSTSKYPNDLKYIFNNINSNARLYVPINLLADYQEDNYWKYLFGGGIYPIGGTPGQPGTTACKTKITYNDGSTKEFEINDYLTFDDSDNISAATKVDIGNCITSIGDYAFWSCSNLTAISIPDTVNTIGDFSFSGCTSLTSISFEGTKEIWNYALKGDDWHNSVPAKVVHCTDGDVAIE